MDRPLPRLTLRSLERRDGRGPTWAGFAGDLKFRPSAGTIDTPSWTRSEEGNTDVAHKKNARE